MKLKWSKSDQLRARKMGWCLVGFNNPPFTYRLFRDGVLHNTDPDNIESSGEPSPFKNEREAAEWVLRNAHWPDDGITANSRICRKAILICMLGGES